MLKQNEWIEIIISKTGCTKKDAKMFYDCVFDYMREQIAPEQPVKISGFGVFKLRKTAAKEQINLITGQPEIVPEHNVITFKPYFEIDPKPEPIEVEVEVEDVVTADNEVVEPTVVAEETKEEVVEEAPVEEKVDDGFRWIYNQKEMTTEEVTAVLSEKTTLSVADIHASLNVVMENMKKFGKTMVEVKEDENTFDFVIVK